MTIAASAWASMATCGSTAALMPVRSTYTLAWRIPCTSRTARRSRSS